MATNDQSRRLFLPAVLLLGLASAAGPACAEPPPPPLAGPPLSQLQCDQFAHLYRYAEESKALCEEGRQVKAGPMTSNVLSQCRMRYATRFDQVDVSDMMNRLTQDIQSQGLGNACNVASRSAWSLVLQ